MLRNGKLLVGVLAVCVCLVAAQSASAQVVYTNPVVPGTYYYPSTQPGVVYSSGYTYAPTYTPGTVVTSSYSSPTNYYGLNQSYVVPNGNSTYYTPGYYGNSYYGNSGYRSSFYGNGYYNNYNRGGVGGIFRR